MSHREEETPHRNDAIRSVVFFVIGAAVTAAVLGMCGCTDKGDSGSDTVMDAVYRIPHREVEVHYDAIPVDLEYVITHHGGQEPLIHESITVEELGPYTVRVPSQPSSGWVVVIRADGGEWLQATPSYE